MIDPWIEQSADVDVGDIVLRLTASIVRDGSSAGCDDGQQFGSGDLLSLRPYFSFHGGLSLQALEIARDGYDS
jgi:hypothetical protein